MPFEYVHVHLRTVWWCSQNMNELKGGREFQQQVAVMHTWNIADVCICVYISMFTMCKCKCISICM